MDDHGRYICDHCGEEVTTAELDPTAGNPQEFVEDCPVCCSPNVLQVRWDEDGRAIIEAQIESA